MQSFSKASLLSLGLFRVGQHEYAGSGALADLKYDLIQSLEKTDSNNNNKLRRELAEMRGSPGKTKKGDNLRPASGKLLVI